MSAVTIEWIIVVTKINLAVCWKLWLCCAQKNKVILLISVILEVTIYNQADNQQVILFLMSYNQIKKIPPDLGNYIAGFSDGEGSFIVSLRKRSDYRSKWKVSASFNISQKDRVILSKIKNTFKCGTLRERQDGVVYYEVTNITALHDTIIPFFQKFRFLSAKKKKEFRIFSQIVDKMYRNEHVTAQGLRTIIQLREHLNEGRGRKRKYTKKDVYQGRTSETTRKTRLKS